MPHTRSQLYVLHGSGGSKEERAIISGEGTGSSPVRFHITPNFRYEEAVAQGKSDGLRIHSHRFKSCRLPFFTHAGTVAQGKSRKTHNPRSRVQIPSVPTQYTIEGSKPAANGDTT